MTLNDFKSIEGDKQFGVNSLPVKLGEKLAAKVGTPCLLPNTSNVPSLGSLIYWDFL